MDNKTVLSEHKFILQDDGKIYLMDGDSAVEVSNQEEVKQWIWDNVAYLTNGEIYSLLCSVEKKETEKQKPLICFKQEIAVSRGYKLWSELSDSLNPYSDDYELLYNEAWGGFNSQNKTVALVTFYKPEEKETQEELEDRVQITLSMNLGTFERVVKALKTDPEIWEEVREELTRLSKEFENP